uniref:NADH dehydrogenase [ubiquinone] 1 alpha subcomplex subunit 12 n=1 Tax=Chlamydomonas leiostraca TaxID=1034604 RepID=A0A7S0WPG8_9CHLO|mmetsp:Transcript_22186/g.56368  ORF Transcript_22186/g.56368 Transcript_22186/m.56368 type:complete len:156 (+) Transcript_22186:155-622(+)|eukprot:CAMPEP_0202865258 /NCGR_PEP_ID=MMETSP1391-20130828/5464_1 /ASSEMBLY_ACC=CAM_ASM_000867 /TAXON_ID=1034604 /ORGANISM="Chlamydomonas leiostraca, Strain SAG 11-49" /LENGTH=155 /DNA_ID=CAMNT_0049545071 /DNA_START=122 /DNA_END=592 /DNA_ORIENTATION=+
MSLTQHIDKVVKASGKSSLLKLIFSLEGLKMFGDGNIGYSKLIRGPTAGKLVGTDYHGNAYYENNDLGYNRKRWVLYKDTFNYSPTSVPPEWHGWLEGINDFTPANYDFKKPAYGIQAMPSRTGTTSAYAPKGVWANTGKRNWKKYEAWVPPQQP